jgi:hypothetical protein
MVGMIGVFGMIGILRRPLRRIRYGEPVVVVSGLPRTGTSMMMQMLAAGGIEPVTDGLRAPDEDNPEGYLEYEPVKDLEDAADHRWLHDARGRAVKIIAFLLEHLPETHNYRVVFMNRKLDEVLASQATMLDRRGETDETEDARMRRLYIDLLARTRTMLSHRAHFEVHHARYPEVIADPLGNAREVSRFLGGGLDVEAMASVVNPELYRNRR